VAPRLTPRPAGIARHGVLIVIAALLASCVAARTPTYPPAGSTPGPAGSSTSSTVARVVAALAGRGLQASETSKDFRPPQAARFAAAPRSVVQVALSNDPDRGFIVIYAFASAAEAAAAAAEQATYVSTGPGHLLFPPETRYTLRIDGSNVVFFTWSAASAADPRTADIESALATIGTGVTVPA
jgi:hypothetical protein